jgi:uncharacterized protein
MSRHNTLITGASSGIGATYADRLARRGHDLVLVARDESRMEALAARLRGEHGVAVEVLAADLAVASELARIERRLREDSTITMLVNNAGIGGSGAFATADPERIEAIIRVNVLAVSRLAAAATPGFVARRSGTIVNVASIAALVPEVFETVYLATKAYVLALSQAMQRELAPQGVRVQVVLPGNTRTEIWTRSGVDLESIPPDTVMEVGEMVDAALAGLDLGELVTIPSLPDTGDWDAFTQARLRLAPHLSRRHPAGRYAVTPAA